MRHRVKTTSLHRDIDHRKALIKNLSSSIVEHEKVVTTLAKAKFIRPHIEKLITRAKKGADFNNVKYMKNKLTTDENVRKILTDLGPRFSGKPGGYTRIIKIGNRDGDKAEMARIELTEKPVKKEKKAAKENKTTEVKAVLAKRGRPKKIETESKK